MGIKSVQGISQTWRLSIFPGHIPFPSLCLDRVPGNKSAPHFASRLSAAVLWYDWICVMTISSMMLLLIFVQHWTVHVTVLYRWLPANNQVWCSTELILIALFCPHHSSLVFWRDSVLQLVTWLWRCLHLLSYSYFKQCRQKAVSEQSSQNKEWACYPYAWGLALRASRKAWKQSRRSNSSL